MSLEVMKQAHAASFEFSDKGAAEVVVCKTGLTYGVQCVGFQKVFAQFTFESDAKQFAEIFNGTVAQKEESPATGGGGGFESRPVPVNEPAVVRQLVEALRMVMDDPDALDGRPRTHECVQEALSAAKEAGL